MAEAAPTVFVDAAAEGPALFGLSGVERLRRTLAKQGLEPVISEGPEPVSERLGVHLARHPGPVLVLEGAVLTDPRLIAHLAGASGTLVARTEEGAAIRLDPGALPEAATVPELADALLAGGETRLIEDAFDGFIGVLRRDLPFYVRRAAAGEERALERWMFFANYKGSTDLLTAHVFPPLVWPATRWCAAHGVHPNTVTWVSVALTVLAAVLFWYGWFWAGLLSAYAMAVLDSVDGKLARVTLTDSAFGNVLDHGLDIVHPPFWYLAWAHGMVAAGGDPLLWQAAWWMTGLYIADRLVLMVAKARFGRGLHAMTPLDGQVRSVISRRNTNLAILTAGLALGANEWAFLAVVGWQGATALWHAVRTAMLYPRGRA